jgi:ATP/maltotriose-dependent transcriptional regulator MalT
MRQATAAPVRQPKIIERPRLTRQLDACGARIVMLVAAAGYGKTTLARQWLVGERRPAWYRCTNASSDVAALAAGLAVAAAELVEGAGRDMLVRCGLSSSPADEAALLAEMLARDLRPWPADAWIVIDDYHLAAESPACEQFVETLVQGTGVQLLVTTRRSPSWASMRSVLIGERFELDAEELAMTDEEAREVLDDEAVLRVAHGWPAVIGLAAFTPDRPAAGVENSDALHRYLTEELFRKIPEELHLPISLLAVCSSLPIPLASKAFGAKRLRRCVEAGTRSGLLLATTQIEMHPLVRAYCRDRLSSLLDDGLVGRVAEELMHAERWDDAFAVIEASLRHDLLESFLEEAVKPALAGARYETLERWLAFGRKQGMTSPLLLYGEAEIACRRGDQRRADALAVQAARALPPDHALAASAWNAAGRAAHLRDNYREAIRRHEIAEQQAETPRDLRDAIWGQFTSGGQLDDETCVRLADRVIALDDRSLEGTLRMAGADYHRTLRRGSLAELEDVLRRAFELASHVVDPWQASSFLNTFSRWLSLRGLYDEALAVQESMMRLVEHHQLLFAMPSVLTSRAAALMGKREFAAAASALRAADSWSSKMRDLHIEMDSTLLHVRLMMMRGRFDEADRALRERHRKPPGPAMEAEYQATAALLDACGSGARSQTIERRSIANMADAEVLLSAANAVVALRESESVSTRVDNLIDVIATRGVVDGLVVAYRSYLPLLAELAARDSFRETLREILINARDRLLAHRVGIDISDAVEPSPLSPREREIHEFLRQGLTNKQIAKLLFIQEVTVKVHVRHILEKLGARSRAEAAARELSS